VPNCCSTVSVGIISDILNTYASFSKLLNQLISSISTKLFSVTCKYTGTSIAYTRWACGSDAFVTE
jgi:hypothetical protein